ncbi:hypothetical protein [Albidovulum inexpectatum]|uniref:hypothetical protein n=1 Tax=Albidovulum inexpectatum TaxID=196587 RepID=UPI0011AFED6B|nr:hypothetical protein [Albidovulum inexpectatum]
MAKFLFCNCGGFGPKPPSCARSNQIVRNICGVNRKVQSRAQEYPTRGMFGTLSRTRQSP